MKKNREGLLWAALLLALVVVILLMLTLSSRDRELASIRDLPKIVILQAKPQKWADALKLGFQDGLRDQGLELGADVLVLIRSAAADPQGLTALADTIARQNYQLVYSLGTQATEQAFRAVKDTPIVFGALTDPVRAGFFDRTLDNPRGNITGTQDIWPYPAQFDLMQKLLPNLKKLGIVYNSSEINSQVSVGFVRAECETRSIELVERTVTEEAQISPAVTGLLSAGIHALFIPADNTVQTSADTIIAACTRELIPVFSGIPGIVANGALGTVGTNYYDLGKANARQAAEILAGRSARDIPVIIADTGDIHLNLRAAQALGIAVPQDLVDSALVVYR